MTHMLTLSLTPLAHLPDPDSAGSPADPGGSPPRPSPWWLTPLTLTLTLMAHPLNVMNLTLNLAHPPAELSAESPGGSPVAQR